MNAKVISLKVPNICCLLFLPRLKRLTFAICEGSPYLSSKPKTLLPTPNSSQSGYRDRHSRAPFTRFSYQGPPMTCQLGSLLYGPQSSNPWIHPSDSSAISIWGKLPSLDPRPLRGWPLVLLHPHPPRGSVGFHSNLSTLDHQSLQLPPSRLRKIYIKS